METLPTIRRGRRYTPDFKQRAVDAVLEWRQETGLDYGSIQHVADTIGCGAETLRQWVRRFEREANRPDVAVPDGRPSDVGMEAPSASARLAQLEHEVRELRRANDFLKQVSLYFAAEAHHAGNRDQLRL